MVFAVWAGQKRFLTVEIAEAFVASYRWGMEHMGEIVSAAVAERGFGENLAREYLTRHIVYELSGKHMEGLKLFRGYARALEGFAKEV
jgi:predicted solute-binding protein